MPPHGTGSWASTLMSMFLLLEFVRTYYLGPNYLRKATYVTHVSNVINFAFPQVAHHHRAVNKVVHVTRTRVIVMTCDTPNAAKRHPLLVAGRHPLEDTSLRHQQLRASESRKSNSVTPYTHTRLTFLQQRILSRLYCPSRRTVPEKITPLTRAATALAYQLQLERILLKLPPLTNLTTLYQLNAISTANKSPQ
jgi:hypothetical protein